MNAMKRPPIQIASAGAVVFPYQPLDFAIAAVRMGSIGPIGIEGLIAVRAVGQFAARDEKPQLDGSETADLCRHFRERNCAEFDQQPAWANTLPDPAKRLPTRIGRPLIPRSQPRALTVGPGCDAYMHSGDIRVIL
jgi:hypothetical protein